MQPFFKGSSLISLRWAGVLLLTSELGKSQTHYVAGEREVLENKVYFVKWLEDTLT